MPIDGTPAHAFFPTVGMFSSLTLVLRWAHSRPLLLLDTTTFSKPVEQP